MKNRYGLVKQGRSEEFREEDVWDVMNDEGCGIGFKSFGEFKGEKPQLLISRRVPSAAMMIPGTQKHVAPNADDHDEKSMMMHQHSAPVNIPPDWSRIYGKSPRRKKNGTGNSASSSIHDDDDDDDDDERGTTLPPHEWVARKLARRQISSSSVCEGAGRTLKGRDLSRVRNAVLSKTGFI